MKPKIIAALVLVLVSLIILVQNRELVVFQILFWKIIMSKILMILGMMTVGFALGLIVGRLRQEKRG